jgi:hypothetical protein
VFDPNKGLAVRQLPRLLRVVVAVVELNPIWLMLPVKGQKRLERLNKFLLGCFWGSLPSGVPTGWAAVFKPPLLPHL